MNDERADIQIVNPNGIVSIQEIFTIVFYIPRANLDIVENAERAILGFKDLVSIEALPEYYNYEGEQEDLTEESLRELIYERLFGPNRAPNAHIELIGIGKSIYAPDYYLTYSGSSLEIPGLDDEVSLFWCWMPRNFYKNYRNDVFEYIMTLADDFPFSFAHASFGLSGEDRFKKQALVKRYPGLDISNPDCIQADIDSKAAGSYWLTLLGTELCQSIGGVSALRDGLPKNISIEELPGNKCYILLSKEPEIGDVNRRNLLPKHQALTMFFHDKNVLHIPKRVVYFVDEEGMADRDAMEAWHQRFLN